MNFLENIPEELLLHIFSFIDDSEYLNSVKNSTIHRVYNDPLKWKKRIDFEGLKYNDELFKKYPRLAYLKARPKNTLLYIMTKRTKKIGVHEWKNVTKMNFTDIIIVAHDNTPKDVSHKKYWKECQFGNTTYYKIILQDGRRIQLWKKIPPQPKLRHLTYIICPTRQLLPFSPERLYIILPIWKSYGF